MPLQTCAECPLKAKHGKKITAYKGRAKAGTADYCEVPFRGPKTSVDVMIVGESPEPGEVGCGGVLRKVWKSGLHQAIWCAPHASS